MMMRERMFDEYRTYTIYKQLTGDYDKGVIESDGSVLPHRLDVGGVSATSGLSWPFGIPFRLAAATRTRSRSISLVGGSIFFGIVQLQLLSICVARLESYPILCSSLFTSSDVIFFFSAGLSILSYSIARFSLSIEPSTNQSSVLLRQTRNPHLASL